MPYTAHSPEAAALFVAGPNVLPTIEPEARMQGQRGGFRARGADSGPEGRIQDSGGVTIYKFHRITGSQNSRDSDHG
jgi:hypothetical protein